MGLFDTLFGTGRPEEPDGADRIWMTSEAKFAAIRAEVAGTPASDVAAILLVAHFPDVLQRLEQLAAACGRLASRRTHPYPPGRRGSWGSRASGPVCRRSRRRSAGNRGRGQPRSPARAELHRLHQIA